MKIVTGPTGGIGHKKVKRMFLKSDSWLPLGLCHEAEIVEREEEVPVRLPERVTIDFGKLDMKPWLTSVVRAVREDNEVATYTRSIAVDGYIFVNLWPLERVTPLDETSNTYICTFDYWIEAMGHKHHYRSKDFALSHPREDYTDVPALREKLADSNAVHIIVDRQVRDELVEQFESYQDAAWVAPFDMQADGLLMVLDGKGVFTDAALPTNLRWVNMNQGDSGRPQYLIVDHDHAKYYETKE
jgi:hypothetical protein